ncbi:MAG: universal stress protein [Anaerolineae bacterium]|nr:universal stress protein [Anaerolineae bacterium]
MSIILCATRGGEASLRTQTRAIAIAKERGASLLYIFVADARFIHNVSEAIVVDAETEIEHMGEFLLLMAKERAEQAGVAAEYVVARGNFAEAMKQTARERRVDLVIFGSPGEESSVTQLKFLETLCQDITGELGIEAVIV